MGYYTYTDAPIGNFIEKEYGHNFEYTLSIVENYPHKVWVGSGQIGGDSGWRYANVKKTVAYVIVDEDDGGGPVLERWFLKSNKEYLV